MASKIFKLSCNYNISLKDSRDLLYVHKSSSPYKSKLAARLKLTRAVPSLS